MKPRRTRQVRRWLRACLSLLVCLGLMTGVALLMGQDAGRHLTLMRGVEDGLAPGQPPLSDPRFGVNVSLERYNDDEALAKALELIRSLGFGAVRQRFSWADLEPAPGQYDWQAWDHLLPMVRACDLQIIAVLDTSPSWARPAWEGNNLWAPPAFPEDYARFARAFAERYGDLVTAYQVWDQPNITPHWGKGPINPGGYVELLRMGSQAIRAVDADARIIAGGLAPNLESGGRNMSDLLFLREIYRRGASAHFDVLGAKPYGFWSGPDDRRVDPSILNFSRVILLREEMVRRGDADKPIWAMESGWCSLPSDWRGKPSPQGSDEPFIQGERLHRALLRVRREWPWMGLMCLHHLQPDAPTDDPVWGYALVELDGTPRPLRDRVCEGLSTKGVLYPGLTREPRLAAAQDAGVAEFRFWGTDLTLAVKKGSADGQLSVSVDAQQAVVLLNLDEEAGEVERVRVGRGLSLGVHRVRVHGATNQIAAIQAVQVGNRPSRFRLWSSIFVGLLGLVQFGFAAFRPARTIPWKQAWKWSRGRWTALPKTIQWSAAIVCFVVAVSSPLAIARLLGLALYLLSALLGPEQALFVAIACMPLAPLHVRLGPGSFSVSEVSLLAATAAYLWNALLEESSGAAASRGSPKLHPSTLDWAVLLLVFLGAATSLVAEYRRVAFREFRLVVAEAALLYFVVRTRRGDRRWLPHAVDVLWVSATCVALYALLRYLYPGGVIEAEGVRRARAFYGSPNNLALYLERVMPLGLAVLFWGRTGWRRWVYGLGIVPVALALFLTFSRGVWFLGVPAMFVALAWAGGMRACWLVVGLLIIGFLAVMPLAGTERLLSLLDLSHGTAFLRISLWQSAWDMVRDHPWLGLGLDNFLYYYGDYIRPGAAVDRWLSHPHNMVLDFGLRLGIGGVGLLLALLIGFFKKASGLLRVLPKGDLRAMTLGLIAGMTAVIAHGSVDSSYFVIELAYWFMFALAWIANPEQRAQPAEEPNSTLTASDG